MSSSPSRLDDLRIERAPEGQGPRRSWPWVLLAGVAVAALLGWWLLRDGAPRVTVAEASPARVAGQTRGVLDASGYVTARRQATVSSKVTGKVTEVFVEEGLEVAEGQLLARLDPATPAAALSLARAQVEAARSAREETRVRIAEARLDLERAGELLASGVTSQAEVDRAQAQLDALEARHAAQGDDLRVAERALTIRAQDVEDTEIRAPFAGVVTSKNAQPGEMISPISAGGGFTRTGICTIVDMESLEIEVDVNEAYIQRVRAGQPVVAVLDAYPDWQIPARVLAIVPTADRQKATVRVRIAFAETDPRILPDMGVKVTFVAEEPEGTGAAAGSPGAVVPRAAVRQDGEQDVVWVVAGESVERRAVRVGAARGETVEIEAGLQPGERVVTSGFDGLADGAAVAIVEEAE